MATPPDKSKFSDRKPQSKSAHDYFLEPLPVPEATESDTDTAWGLWENTLRGFEDEAKKPEEPKQQDFEDTVPSDLLPDPKKP